MPASRSGAHPLRGAFDGVVCFGGEDWWYHNRGHYDMQMMREFSADLPVLYVNSIGMRVPRLGEGAMFFSRVRRKLRSMRRGFTQVRERFAVCSPFAVPGRWGAAATRFCLPAQVRRAAARAGIRRPLLWVACPTAAEVVDAIPHVALVYQRTDRYEAFSGVDPQRIRACDRALKSRADITLFCSSLLHDEESAQCRRALFVDHGVDYDRFAAAGERSDMEPDDVRPLPRPRVGFIGGIDAHTFDPALFVGVARRMPNVTFVLVGACSLPVGWCPLSNVVLLGQRPYEQVAGYMAACDALIMPWNQSEWIRACNPVKLKEYLAVGRPVVTTPFDELRNFAGLVRVARGEQEFAEALHRALTEPHDPEPGRARVRDETWAAKARLVRAHLASGESGRRAPASAA